MLNWKGMLTAALVALACIPASQAIAAPVHVIDALNRDVVVDAPAKRIVLGFYFEEFTAVAGTSGWNRVVGLSKATWAGWRAATWKEYVKVIPRLQDLPDVGYAGDNTFSVEKVLALRPDLLILSQLEFDSLGTSKSRLDAAGIPIVVIDYNAQTLQRPPRQHACHWRRYEREHPRRGTSPLLSAQIRRHPASCRRRPHDHETQGLR
ncbi:hypothetical protein [Paraburkholderia sp. MM6662-R1]|uniref:hypothetical protein n=1 Tax=Paraburkholderia sp. MM6662-R1 TaxID=2991066 RepID=UPI003D20A4EE